MFNIGGIMFGILIIGGIMFGIFALLLGLFWFFYSVFPHIVAGVSEMNLGRNKKIHCVKCGKKIISGLDLYLPYRKIDNLHDISREKIFMASHVSSAFYNSIQDVKEDRVMCEKCVKSQNHKDVIDDNGNYQSIDWIQGDNGGHKMKTNTILEERGKDGS